MLRINSTGLSVETFGEFWKESIIEAVSGTVAERDVQDKQLLIRYLMSLLNTANIKLMLQFWTNDGSEDFDQYIIQVEQGAIYAFSIQHSIDEEVFLPCVQNFESPESLIDAICEGELDGSENTHYSIHTFGLPDSEDDFTLEPPTKKARTDEL